MLAVRLYKTGQNKIGLNNKDWGLEISTGITGETLNQRLKSNSKPPED